MELIPSEELKAEHRFNFAPMIDFLFLMLALFATLTISRATLFDTEISLAQLKSERQHNNSSAPKKDIQQINLSITAEGNYKWLTEFESYPMETIGAIQKELSKQYHKGILPQDKSYTEVLLHIDQKAPWDAVVQAIFGIRELGFTPRPIYEPAPSA